MGHDFMSSTHPVRDSIKRIHNLAGWKVYAVPDKGKGSANVIYVAVSGAFLAEAFA